MHIIRKYEYEKLQIGEQGFSQNHWKSLLKLNEKFENRYFDILHEGIKFRQYVGVIQIDDLLIEIHPKADKHSGNTAWRNVLIPMLIRAGYLNIETAGEAFVRRQPLNLIQVYFSLFLNRMEALIRQGLVKQYRQESGNTRALKGKLEFAAHLRHNLVHRERFYTRHQVYDTDHLLHKVLRRAAEIVRDFSRGTSLSGYSKRILTAFPEISTAVTKSSLKKVKFNRKTRHYASVWDLARLIILNFSPGIRGGSMKMLSLLFDMNLLWEQYVFQSLLHTVRRHPVYAHLRISAQEPKPFTGRHYLQPDIVIRNTRTGETHIIDTKWKQPENKEASIADLRQMYVYARYWQARKTVLLYPSSVPAPGEFQVFVPAPGEKDAPIFYKTAFIPVITAEGELDTELGEKILGLVEFTSQKN